MGKSSGHQKVIKSPARKITQGTPTRTPQFTRHSRGRQKSVCETPRLAPYRTPPPRQKHRRFGITASHKRSFAGRQKSRALRAYKKAIRREGKQSGPSDSAPCSTVEVMHVAEKVDSTWDNCDSDGSDSVDVEEAGWKGDVESPLMPVEQTPLSSGRRAMRALKRPRSNVADDNPAVDAAPTASAMATVGKPPEAPEARGKRKKALCKLHTKSIGTGQPFMGNRIQAILTKLKS